MSGLRGMYLAYPIDLRGELSSSDVHLFQQIEKLKGMVTRTGIVSWVFDPGDAFTVSKNAEPDKGLPLVNRAALNNSDVVVAFLPKHMPSVGVPMEIDRAHSQGKHVIVLTDARSWMLDLPRMHVIRGWDDDMLEVAWEIINGMQPVNPTPRFDEMPVVIDHEYGRMPTRAYEDDAGLDLYVSDETTIMPGTFSDVPCGISCELPDWSWGLVTGRSSALRKRGLLVHSGVIDAGYRGPLYAGAWNMTDQPVTVEVGERIAQMIIVNNATKRVNPVRSDQLTQSARGAAGFGSSGA